MASVCTHCGHDIPAPDEANRRIQDLEAQVRLLNSKAEAAVDRLADYEDEVNSLRAAYAQLQQQKSRPRTSSADQLPSAQPPPSVPTPQVDQQVPRQGPTPTTTPPIATPSPTPTPASPPRTTSRLASLSSFLPGRKRDTTLLNPLPNIPSTGLFPQHQPGTTTTPPIDPPQQQQQPPLTLLSLQQTLENERTLRLQAESNLTQTQVELEELTATLFGQANEMVATERKARAKLEERVKVLEDRDGEKRKRLERLERALERIDRVRGLVGDAKDETGKDVVGLRVVNTVTTPLAEVNA